VEVTSVLINGADLNGAEDGWGVTTDEAEWGVVRCRLVRTYRCLPLEGTKVGGDQLEAKHDGKEDISVDAAV
jgi:hypothetical protein